MGMKLNPNENVVAAIRKRLVVTGEMCPCVPQPDWCEDTRCLNGETFEESGCRENANRKFATAVYTLKTNKK